MTLSEKGGNHDTVMTYPSTRRLGEEEQEVAAEFHLQILRKIGEVLRGLGFSIVEQNIEKKFLLTEAAALGIPLVEQGSQGIRFVYRKTRGDLKVFFCNSFAHPDSADRVRVVEAINKAQLGKYVIGGAA
ncbi:MAG: hypothetical protein EXS55_00970 [Candidatus Magasanikbacteria bacterium]|nr:hypothetical protein [Candidatus Magasanikbacteria bacterium]